MTTNTRSVAGTSVDDSYLRLICEDRTRKHGDEFDPSDLVSAKHFAPYMHKDVRLKVRRGDYVRTGRVGITTGWKPVFLLVYRTNAHGSSDLLTADDEIVAIWNGRYYVDVEGKEGG